MKRTRRVKVYAMRLWIVLFTLSAWGQETATNKAGAAGEDAGRGARPSMEFKAMEKKRSPQEVLLEANKILNEPMSLNFRNTELREVLNFIALKSKLNFIMNPDGVKGKVTLHLENVRLYVALEHILKINNLAFVISDENIVRIVPADSLGIEKVETLTEIVQIDWVTASAVAKTLQNFVSKNGRIVADVETNSLIITDTPPKLEILRELVEKIDQPERQVLIEARLVEMQTSAVREMGSRFNFFQGDAEGISEALNLVDVPGSSAQPAQPAVFDADGFELFPERPWIPAIPATQQLLPVDLIGFDNIPPQMQRTGQIVFGDKWGILGQDYNVSAILAGFANRNIVEILANPRVMTINNISATIEMIKEIPYIDEAQNESSTARTAKFKDSGIKIQVTPIITPNGYIRMNLLTEQLLDSGRFQGVPVIETRKADTNVIILSGETVMIGGLRQMRISDQRSGLPWLQNIPVLGWMFKHKLDQQDKTDLYLFVTPTIIEQPELTAEQQGFYDRMDLQWELPDYFFDDVKVDEDMD